jgi:hypothetical protein
MTVSTLHKFHSTYSDGTDASLVKPSNWNDQHALTGTPNYILGFDGSGNAIDLASVPAVSVSGLATVATSGSASDLSTGTLPDARLSNVVTAGGPTGSATVVPVITYDAHGRLTAVTTAAIATATTGNLGIVQPDGTTITIVAGVITAASSTPGYVLEASSSYNHAAFGGL